jgi:mono/diheme cytochrome c family protein
VPEGDVDRGRRLYAELQCGACHRIGTEGETVGPELTHAGRLLRSYTAAVLRAPQTVWPTSQMPDLGLTDLQVADLAAYLSSLRWQNQE